MSYGKPLLFPNGKKYLIQSKPLNLDRPKFAKVQAALDGDDLHKTALEMVKLQNEVDEDEFEIDLDTWYALLEIWNAVESQKKTYQAMAEIGYDTSELSSASKGGETPTG